MWILGFNNYEGEGYNRDIYKEGEESAQYIDVHRDDENIYYKKKRTM